MAEKNLSSTFSGILSYLWSKNGTKLRLFFVFSILFLLLSKISSTVAPFIFKILFDEVGSSSKSLSIVPLGLVILFTLLRLSSQIFNELKEATFVLLEQNALKKLALEVFEHLHSLSLKFHLNKKTGEITKSIERGVKAIETILRFSTFSILPTFIEIFLVCAFLIVFYPVAYAAIIACTLFGYSWYTIAITEWRVKYIRIIKDTDNTAGYRAIDSLLNYETVKYFNNEEFEINNYSTLLEKYRRLAVKNRISLSLLNIGQALIIAVGASVINYIAISDIISGHASIGDLALINVYLTQLYVPLNNLGFAYREIKFSYLDIENMFSLLREKKEIIDKPNASKLIVKSGEIEFRNVRFQYNEDREILNGITFSIPACNTCAIVGKSGSGKSTISKLLFRFYEVTDGIIKIDDQDISEVRQRSVHQSIGVVPQDTILFNHTILYNILYGNISSSLDDVINVAKLSNIHDFIESLPEKYNTVVGERGLKLSGGEKQRVAIARLLLKNPKIFIFDEATSSLDTKTEKVIQNSIKKISEGHTTLIIAHRLSTIVDADEILVLDHGEIKERGNHQQLINANGLYHSMWEQQKNESGSSQLP